MKNQDKIIDIIRKCYPDIQVIYIFGTFGTKDEWLDSDVDIAVLLPHQIAKKAGSLILSECKFKLEEALKKSVDLINLRQVSTVFQNEIVTSSQKIFCQDENAMDEFEMLTLSFYQQLNTERKAILKDIQESGRVFQE